MCKNLSNSPNIEILQELYFHLKELYWDITSLVKKMGELLLNFANTSLPLEKIESLMSSITSQTEHDATYHLAEALKLAGQLLEKQSLLETSEYLASQEMDWKRAKQPLDDEEIDDLARLNQELQQLTKNLHLSLDIINQIINRQEKVIKWEQLEDKLGQLAEVLGTRSWTDVQKLYGQVCRLERAANPEKYAMEDYLEMLATPLHEIYHPSACSLSFCPSCGTPLTGDDRTFVGSYCEVCRTAWIEFSEDS
jgi:hypothetical protein